MQTARSSRLLIRLASVTILAIGTIIALGGCQEEPSPPAPEDETPSSADGDGDTADTDAVSTVTRDPADLLDDDGDPPLPSDEERLAAAFYNPVFKDLIVEDVSEGDGEALRPGCMAVFEALLQTTDGRVLQNTHKEQRLFEMFYPGNYADGLVYGPMGQRVGGVRKITIPPHLGFGSSRPNYVQPDETIVATLRLVDVQEVPNVELESGLKIASDGTGEGPKAYPGDYVVFHITIMVGDDKRVVWESRREGNGTVNVGLPAPFGIIRRRRYEPEMPIVYWCLWGIKAGETREVTLPPRHAYGARGYERFGIGPNDTVHYTIECVRVETGPTYVLDNGMVIEDIVVGDGEYVSIGLYHTFRQRRLKVDGTVLDETDPNVEPTHALIPRNTLDGWNTGMLGMRVGGHRRFIVPPHLAYQGRIPEGLPLEADEDIVYEVWLYDVTREKQITDRPETE